ncbi:S8 family serine peptidase [Crossiella cryophila]|uniref:Peptidase S8/S53 domain-containing protein n=1 Tax=Crossiella cryophila TaxID=43355 RepID=A0A7W7FU99_9PSEU|nr:S8 family serine peptidase [Crossiella cryophila]MBB4679071.1 hypothetical protein [Crossiella cryophila]
MSRRSAALVAVCALCAFGFTPVAAAQQCAAPAGNYTGPVNWAQRLIGAERVWPLTDGAGQRIAVVAPGGVESAGQLAGRVREAQSDCDGRGTFAAGIIAAPTDPGTTFAGIAPGSQVLSVRVPLGDPDSLAAGINRAVEGGATVIAVVSPSASGSGALSAAVRNAFSRNVVVVASAAGDKPGSRTYPGALPGVLAVGGIDANGSPVSAEGGEHISLAAPGSDLVSVSAGGRGHRWGVGAPAFAVAYVAGAAALVRGYRSELTVEQVRTRLLVTASGAGGAHDPLLGWGVLDAYSAVTAELPEGIAAPVVGERPSAGPKPTVVIAAGPARTPRQDRLAGALAVLGVLAAGVAVVATAAARRGRARGWRIG